MATNTRERAKKNAENRDKRPQAIAKYLRISSSKVIIVLDLIRGKRYEDAVNILSNTNKSASPLILKVLNSAAANAENNLNMSKDTLFVAECYATQGPTYKRMMPRAKGRGDRILKRTSHIRVILDEKQDVAKTIAKAKPSKTAASAEKKPEAPKKPEKKSEGATVKKTTTTPKPKSTPGKGAENPITETPNAKKPLGTKKEVVKKEGN